VLTRSGHHPILVGLGAAAVVAVAMAPSATAEDTPSPSPGTASPVTTPTPSPTSSSPPATVTKTPTPPATKTPTPSPTTTPTKAPPPPVPVLEVSTTPVAAAAHPGDKVILYVVVHANKAVAHKATLVLSTKPKAATTPTGSHALGDLTSANKTVTVTVTVPKAMKPGRLVLTAKVAAADKAAPRSTTRTITVAAAAKTSAATTPPATPALPATPSGAGGAGGYTPPSPAGSIQPAGVPGVALPQIAAGQPSSTAGTGLSGGTTSMRDGSPDAQELTFQRVASTQAAWLAALLVVFSVLLTQVRLAGARAVRPRAKGGHRRGRRGLFES
jgi:hypothetical protein